MDLRHKFGIQFDILPIVPIRIHRTLKKGFSTTEIYYSMSRMA